MIPLSTTLSLLLGLVVLDGPPTDPLDALHLFPSEPDVAAALAFSDHHLCWLELQRDSDWLYRRLSWCAALTEARSRRHSWDKLHYLQTSIRLEPFYEELNREGRLELLAELREMLGEEAFLNGWLPQPYLTQDELPGGF